MSLPLLVLVAAECTLRLTGRFPTYTERLGGKYVSPYRIDNFTKWVPLSYPPKATFHYDRSEYAYEVRTNSEQLRDEEHPVEKPSHEFRILGLGDSFTEGMGAPYEETYLKILERRLNTLNLSKRVRTLCGGFTGHDPVFSYQLLTRRLLKYQPDLVILLINRGDVDDIIARGGMDRFESDGHLKKRSPPKPEWIFEHSRFARGIMLTLLRYDYLILSPGAQQHKQREALSVIVDVALQMKSLGEKSGFRFLLAAFSPLDPRLLSGPSFFHPLVAATAQNQIDFVDLTDFFRAHIPPGHFWEYFWPLDCHCTAKGYDVLARGIEDTLRARHMLPEISDANPHVF